MAVGAVLSLPGLHVAPGSGRASHLRNGELGGLGGLITATVNHCATLGYVVDPEAFEQLTMVQVEEAPPPILHASLPVAFVAVPVLWGKEQGVRGLGPQNQARLHIPGLDPGHCQARHHAHQKAIEPWGVSDFRFQTWFTSHLHYLPELR